MKRFLLLLLCLLLFLQAGCSRNDEKNAKEPQKARISDNILTEAMWSFRYSVGPFSIPLKDLLSKSCSDIKINFSEYNVYKNVKLSNDQIQKYENGECKAYLNNTYFIDITGYVRYNPKYQYYVTENKEILTLIAIFNDKDKLVKIELVSKCSEIHTCALIIASS